MSTEVIIHTDGACSGNPGPGGYGAVLRFGELEKEISGGFRKTTNNRMEILAVIKALELLTRPCYVRIYSDSSYVVRAINEGWARRWKANGWVRNRRGHRALNIDLWERVLAQEGRHHKINIEWVRGHTGNPGNERADKLARSALRADRLPADESYEQQA